MRGIEIRKNWKSCYKKTHLFLETTFCFYCDLVFGFCFTYRIVLDIPSRFIVSKRFS